MIRYIDANKFRNYLVTARDKRIDNPLYEEELNNLNYAITQLDNQPSADVQPIDIVLDVINGMITTEHSERNCVIEEVYQKVAELR